MTRSELLPFSRLGAPELMAWAGFMSATAHLQRAFFAPGFARVCDAAYHNAWVCILHDNGRIRGFLPVQFASRWHARIRLAERIGGGLSDNAGLIAEPGVVVDPARLLRQCGLGALFVTHLAEGQEAFGLTASSWEIGHQIDLSDGSAAYFTRLRASRKPFAQDTERRLRRAQRDYGPLRVEHHVRPDPAAVSRLIEAKRAQYRRTQTGDVFASPAARRLMAILAEMAPEDCEPVLTTLFAGDRVLAQHFGLRHAGVLSYWFPVYDPEAQKVSPGRLLLWHTLQAADELGIRLIDRGEGDTEAKRDFSTGTSRFGRANYVANSVRGGLARLWQAAEWRRAERSRGIARESSVAAAPE